MSRGLLAAGAAGLVVLVAGCGGGGSEDVACVPVSDAVVERFGDPIGATVADDDTEGHARWFYGRSDDVVWIADIDPEGDGTGVVRPLTVNAADDATEQRAGGDSTFPDDGPASLSFASNESDTAPGRAIQCAAENGE